MGKAVNPTWVAGHYRWRNDDGTMATATFRQNQDTPDPALPVDTKFRLRINWGESAGQTTGTSWAPKLQYRISGGTYADVGAATPIQYATSGTVADGATETTMRITTAPTGCATSGANATFDSNNATPSKTPVDTYYELEFCLLAASAQVSNGQVYEFQLVNSDGSTFATYDTTPSLTITEASTLSGSGSPSLAPVTATGVFNFSSTYSGSGSASLAPVTATGAGTISAPSTTHTGVGSATLAPVTASGTGRFWGVFSGSGTTSLAPVTASGAGEFWTALSGSGAASVPALTASGSGRIVGLYSGSGAVSLAPVTASGVGALVGVATTLSGSGDTALGGVTASGLGGISVPRTEKSLGGFMPSFPIRTTPRRKRVLSGSGSVTLPIIATGKAMNLGSVPIWKSAKGRVFTPAVVAYGAGRIHDWHKRDRRRRADEEALALLL